MARPLRLEYPGAIYHITARGNDGRGIYEDHDDRWDFLGRLKKVTAQRGWIVLAFCLMGNHYHLVLETPEANLARGMGQLNGGYAQYFNKQYNATGHLFQSRYQALLVQDGKYLLNAIRYTVLNPVRAGLCNSPEQYSYSSYRETISESSRGRIADVDTVLSLFGRELADARKAFGEFVAAGRDAPAIHEEVRTKVFLGDYEFVLRHTIDLHDEKLAEVVKAARPDPRPALENMISDEEDQEGIIYAYREWGYSLREIGKHVGKHHSIIDRKIKELEASQLDSACP